MRIRTILLSLLACVTLAVTSQPTQQPTEWEWYLEEVVSETFVGRNYFEYYYTPSAADMEQQRSKGEVTYFLNSPDGLNSKKVRDMIDRLMASYDDIKAMGDWHMTNTTYWKEFRFEKNKFRFSVKRKALDDGTYYVSATETANYYKSLGKKGKQEVAPKTEAKEEKPTARSTRDRKPVVVPEEKEEEVPITTLMEDDEEEQAEPVLSAKEQRKLEAQRREDEKREQRAKQRREQEQRQADAKAKKEAEKQKKAEEKRLKEEEKKQKEEEKQLKKEEERRQREQARLEREQERQEKAAARKQAAAPKPAESKYHYSDVALWLSEKYDFTQTAGTNASCTMYSTAVKDVEMAKLAIKNALKGSNARMAVPWRVNNETQQVETGYTVDDHVLVFAIGKNDDDNITVTVTEVSNDEFENFKQSINN